MNITKFESLNIMKIDGVDYMLMTQANLSRIVNNRDELGYALITAYRSEIYKDKNGDYSLAEKDGYKLITNPREIEQVNEVNTKNLKLDIKNKKYTYMEVFGGYVQEGRPETLWEKAFIVFPLIPTLSINKETADFNKFSNDVIGWTQNDDNGFNQDFALVRFPNKNPKLFGKDRKPINNKGITGTTLYDVLYEYFTALKDFDKDKSKKFTFTNELYIREFPATINEHRRRSMGGELVRFEFYP